MTGDNHHNSPDGTVTVASVTVVCGTKPKPDVVRSLRAQVRAGDKKTRLLMNHIVTIRGVAMRALRKDPTNETLWEIVKWTTVK